MNYKFTVNTAWDKVQSLYGHILRQFCIKVAKREAIIITF